MEIDDLLGAEAFSQFDLEEAKGSWDGRGVAQLQEATHSRYLSDSSSTDLKSLRQLAMSRAPNKSEANIKGGYDEKRGAYIEGNWTWTWEDDSTEEPPVKEPQNAPSPKTPDTRERV